MSNPWMKFYPSDWQSDERLRVCSIAARGLWVEMLCLMHKAQPYGYLLINGQPPTDSQLAVLVGIPSEQLCGLLCELSQAGVFSKTQKGVLYSRRLVRDEKKASEARKKGKLGGNPSLCNERVISSQDNLPVNHNDKGGDNTQKPEARNQKPDNLQKVFVSNFSALHGRSGDFNGKVIVLPEREFDELCARYSFDGNRDKFRELLKRRDDWYSTQPYKTYSKWLEDTVKWLVKNKAKTI